MFERKFVQNYLTDQFKRKLFDIYIRICLSLIFQIYIDWGDKWLSSFDDKVVPLFGRCNWLLVEYNCPLCIAFRTASVKDENDATVWIGLLSVLDVTSISVDDFVVGENKADDDDEVLGWSDKCFRLANGDQRLGTSVDELGAK